MDITTGERRVNTQNENSPAVEQMADMTSPRSPFKIKLDTLW